MAEGTSGQFDTKKSWLRKTARAAALAIGLTSAAAGFISS